ncbi:MAG: hypothetical protein ABIF82_11160 [Planctomycetota bacterium]
MQLSDNDLRGLFSLFTSVAKEERDQIYDDRTGHHFPRVDLSEEYELTEPKKEYALDAWRAVLYFLYRRGYALYKDDRALGLDWAEDEFC